MIAELLTILAVFVGGCALLNGLGLTGWALPPLGWLAGICLLLDVGFVQLVVGAPGSPAITLVVIVAGPVAWWAVRLRRGQGGTVPVIPVAAGLAAGCAAVLLLRTVNVPKWHSDSLEYVAAGRLVAEGRYRSLAPTYLVSNRVLGVPLLHAPANLAGDLYLRSISPLIWAAMVATVAWLLYNGTRGRVGGRWRMLLIALSVVWLVTDNRVVSNAFYINGHLLVATLLLLIAGAGWLVATVDGVPRRALQVLQVMAVPALVLSRPEGTLLAALVVLPTLLSSRFPPGHRTALLATLGASAALFGGFEAWLYHDRATPIPASIAGPIALGVLLLLAAPLLHRGLPRRDATGWGLLDRQSGRLLVAVEVGLWLALAAYTAYQPHVLRASLKATYHNLALGYGGWGYFVILIGVVVLATLPLRIPNQAHLRFPLTTFVPLVYLLAYLREGAYRTGDTDSLNRMIMHAVPLAVAYVALLLTAGRLVGRRAPQPPGATPPAVLDEISVGTAAESI